MRRFASLIFAATFGVMSHAAFAQTASRPTALVLCLGKTAVRPSQVTITCADANLYAQHLKWTGWGQPFAAAVGDMSINLCTPTCVAGKFETFHTVLIASHARHCSNGVVAYDTLQYAFLGRAPKGWVPDTEPIAYRC